MCVVMHKHKYVRVWTMPWQYLEWHKSVARGGGNELTSTDCAEFDDSETKQSHPQQWSILKSLLSCQNSTWGGEIVDIRNATMLFCVFTKHGIMWAQKHIASISWAWVRITVSAGLLPASGQGDEHTGQYFPDLAACGLHLLTQPQNRKCTELFISKFDLRLS